MLGACLRRRFRLFGITTTGVNGAARAVSFTGMDVRRISLAHGIAQMRPHTWQRYLPSRGQVVWL